MDPPPLLGGSICFRVGPYFSINMDPPDRFWGGGGSDFIVTRSIC